MMKEYILLTVPLLLFTTFCFGQTIRLALWADDKAVPVENSILFYRALKDKGVPAEFHIYPEGGHGFALAIGKGYLSTWTDRCMDWLKGLDH